MNKRFSWIFLAVSGAFFVFIVGLTGYRIEDARRQNAAFARERLPRLTAMTGALRDTTGGYQSAAFKNDMRDLFDAEPRLLLFSVHSQGEGMLYLVARNKSYLHDPLTLSPDWRGTPTYHVSKGYELLLSAPLSSEPQSPTVDALFIIMGREDLYPIMRDDLYLFLAFLLVCGVLVLIVAGSEQETAAARARKEPPRPASKAEPERAPVAESAAAAPPEASPPPGAAPPPRTAAEPSRELTSPRTGLGWADHLEPRLRAELERAASADQDVVLARIRIDEPFADAKLPMAHAEIARILRASFPLHDLIFESGNDSYAVLMPDVDIDGALRVLEELRKKIEAQVVEGRKRTVSIGASSRGGRLIDERTLLEEVNVAVAKASREGGNQVVGFRADAARYRDSLTEARA